MFKPTKSHVREIQKGQYKIRLGDRVPQNAVNLAYSYVAPLTAKENIQIADTSGFILENIVSKDSLDTALWPDETFLLRDENGKAGIYSQAFMLSNVFKDGVPLYYSYRLKYLHYDRTGPDEYGYYTGKAILVVNKQGVKVNSDSEKVHILLRPSGRENLYYVDIYTNFQTKPGQEYRAVYNAVGFDEKDNQYVMTGYSERINALPAFIKKDAITDVTDISKQNESIYYQAQSADFGYSQIYVSQQLFEDTRIPVRFQYIIQAVDNETGLVYMSPRIGSSVLNADSLIAEDTNYRNGFKLLSEESAEDLLAYYYQGTAAEEIIRSGQLEFMVSCNNTDVVVDTKSDGKEPVLARTEADTGVLSLPSNYKLKEHQQNVEFTVQVFMRNKTTGVVTLAQDLGPYRLRKEEGQQDLKLINYAEWDYPEDFEADNYEIFFNTLSPTVPVTVAMWNRETEATAVGYAGDAIPASLFSYTSQIFLTGHVRDATYLVYPAYSLRALDNAQIQVSHPIESDSRDNWFVRVKNGRFYRSYMDENNLPQGFGYFLPEYYVQGFDEVYGMPYKKITAERPQVIDTRQIKVLYTPLFIDTDPETGLPLNIEVYVNDTLMEVKTWDAAEGIIELYGAVRESDKIEVTYYYSEFYYEYRGYYDEQKKRFWYLDLNPGKGHYCTFYDETTDEIKEVPSFGLINKTIYMYMRPAGDMTNIQQVVAENVTLDRNNQYQLEHEALKIFNPRVYLRYADTDIPHVDDAQEGETSWEIVGDAYVYQKIQINNPQEMLEDAYAIDYSYISDKYRFINGTFRKTVLFHSFEEVDEPNVILLGKIQVRPNSSRESVKITDTRSRGGGILSTIGQNIIDEIMPEANSYWDIGYWDGNPYPENAVIVIRLPRHILKQFGGRLTKQEVEASVEKHLAYGVFYIIDYLEEPNALIEVPVGLVAEVVEVSAEEPPKLYPPNFTLITEG